VLGARQQERQYAIAAFGLYAFGVDLERETECAIEATAQPLASMHG